MVAMSVVAIELREQLLAWERELESREEAIASREDGLAAFEHALERVHMERDVSPIQAEVAHRDYLAQVRTFSSLSKQLISLSRSLEEHQILLCLQETDLEVQKVMLVEEQACGLHPHDGWDLSTESEGIRVCVDGIKGERAAEAGQLL
jgi:chromosome segregation ATPase